MRTAPSIFFCRVTAKVDVLMAEASTLTLPVFSRKGAQLSQQLPPLVQDVFDPQRRLHAQALRLARHRRLGPFTFARIISLSKLVWTGQIIEINSQQ